MDGECKVEGRDTKGSGNYEKYKELGRESRCD